ncbi:hypothetical protein A5711_02180 [Mycobacterium sp. E2238]|nr:hypothetical protein A5711_02180 [Mycobacterium sp. E2238]
MRLLHELSPTIGTVVALGAAYVAWCNVKAQIGANARNLDKELTATAANLDKQVAAQSTEAERSRDAQAVEAERNRAAQLQRELRAEWRDALVRATRSVNELRQLAIELHWMRHAARTPDLLPYDHSSDAQIALGEKITAAESELSVHMSVLAVLGLAACAEKLEQFEYALTDFIRGGSEPLDVSTVTSAGRDATSVFAETLRIWVRPPG